MSDTNLYDLNTGDLIVATDKITNKKTIGVVVSQGNEIKHQRVVWFTLLGCSSENYNGKLSRKYNVTVHKDLGMKLFASIEKTLLKILENVDE